MLQLQNTLIFLAAAGLAVDSCILFFYIIFKVSLLQPLPAFVLTKRTMIGCTVPRLTENTVDRRLSK